MKVLIGSALTALAIAVIGGIIVVVVEHGIFDPRTNQVLEPAPTQVSSAPAATPTTLPPAPAEPPAEEPAPASPVDNQTFTEYRIEINGTKLSASEYRADLPPAYYTKVFTAAGEIRFSEGCYVHWELFNNDVLLTTGDSKCSPQQGYAASWWPNSTKLDDGTVRVTASITSDWGETATTETSFTVRND